MKSSQKIIIFERPYDLSLYFLRHWQEMVRKSVEKRGRFCVALQGDKALAECFARLSSLTDYKSWVDVHVFQTDQFHLPYQHSRNQSRYLKENLLDYIGLAPKNFHPIVTHTENPQDSADQYQEELTEFFELSVNESPVFDCVILGLNNIDHFRSLFLTTQKEPEGGMVGCFKVNNLDLISINPEVLAAANHVLLMGTGESCADNAFEWLEVWGRHLPVIKDDPNLLKSYALFLDSVAANRLPHHYEHIHDHEGVILFKS